MSVRMVPATHTLLAFPLYLIPARIFIFFRHNMFPTTASAGSREIFCFMEKRKRDAPSFASSPLISDGADRQMSSGSPSLPPPRLCWALTLLTFVCVTHQLSLVKLLPSGGPCRVSAGDVVLELPMISVPHPLNVPCRSRSSPASDPTQPSASNIIHWVDLPANRGTPNLQTP